MVRNMYANLIQRVVRLCQGQDWPDVVIEQDLYERNAEPRLARARGSIPRSTAIRMAQT